MLTEESTWDEPIDTSPVSFHHDDDAADRAKDTLESPPTSAPPFRPTWEDYRLQSKSPTSSYIRPPRMNFDNSEQSAHTPSLSASMLTLALASPPSQSQSQFQLQSPPRAHPLPSPPIKQLLQSPPLQSLPSSPLPQSQYQPYEAQQLLPAQNYDSIDQRFTADKVVLPSAPEPEPSVQESSSIFNEGYSIRGPEVPREEMRREYAPKAREEQYTAAALAQGDEAEYGFDDSQVFQEEDLSHSQGGSGYGQWNGESDAGQGYDYVSSFGGNYNQQQSSNLYSEQSNYASQTPPLSQAIPQYDTTRDIRSNSTYSLSPTELPHERNPSIPVPSYSNNNFSDSYDQSSSNDYSHQQFATTQAPIQPPVAYPQPNSSTSPAQRVVLPSPNQSYRPQQVLSPPRSPQKAAPSSYTSPRKQSATTSTSSPLRGDSTRSYVSPPQNTTSPMISQNQNNYDSYASYSTPAVQEDTNQYQNDNGNMTAPTSYGNDLRSNQQQQQQQQQSQQQEQYPSYTPYATKVDRRYSFDATPANYSTEPVSRPPLGRATSAPAAAIDLGLERSRAPVVSFAFGGRMLVVFPGLFQQPSYGQPQAINDTSPSVVHIRKVEEILPPDEFSSFPGPMFMDGGKANAGKKRKDALSWLDGRIVELEDENVHRHNGAFGNVLSTKEDARLVLVKLVRALVENEGKLSGT